LYKSTAKIIIIRRKYLFKLAIFAAAEETIANYNYRQTDS